ncbi:lipoprotein [Coxiella burnetii]|uniref:Hypothetical lipoprotein n=1 Tax=Coxiella burnetii (strain RSA 493 / Nine Mile phase I) TaxID=227377 RepID=Q83CM2_COXBU|nr:lipoprotein [Coxiella burnetii]NP_820091.1 lipoprotein [Coxiella burnetii RSA 493]AAO90605.1 hypothetical lipoprotein [Coxiella burnetii RSA 493]ARI65907.1 lipoprotein [Coxiella burnetii]ARK27371.1 hypothetical protein BMW92_05465 [Coxiella burnetii]MCF2094639.1 lipoprotein [Coxiella burnetii]MCF2096665.1 lipoprotein [Coxiella burnetii]
MSKRISVSLIFGLLAGCAEYSHPPARNPQSAHCHAIATQLNQTYPSTLRKRRPPTEKAKLLRAYHSYDCDEFEPVD